ncbi:glutaminyl-peptide cyclotransferase [Nocardia huaxiensis]|uniref:Glutaminyl-peptide cyclotransferase n=1 Tax=Nocardia huaxiensis TaxID=2755382 RepID=A0A7D6VCA0_9NOCA|nr:glutaminyl-peptide cyclotransferase [Nocardia huaxiensis]QLY31651.1 glutaminyl-peptide cyclotransferase [Nocardia huaxiensis]UFS95204.1 glutaminyl-peptide cyclotransferase [Nocardia huaxiensis]
MERKRRAPVANVPILLTTALCLTAATAGCGEPADDTPRMRVEVVGERPHDTSAFTEGLEIRGSVLYESTGLSGRSWVRATDTTTGATVARADLDAPLFGEGITDTGNILWQLTYKDGIAIARDPGTLAELRRTTYEGEGWGLCTRDNRVVMSNGTDTLTFRDPETFAPTGTVTLTSHNRTRLNELDCAPDGSVYANAWPTDDILRIDPSTGAVLAIIDASGLLPTDPRPSGVDVLNGIASIPGTDRFLLSGKNWPTTYEVRFVPN